MTLPHRARVSGFSLVELMVSMAIALVLSLVIARVMIDNEASKRTTTALNDANQNGALAAYELDRMLRSAGSGFMQAWNSANGNALGCLLHARFDGNAVLPRPGGFPPPFAGTPANVHLAPFVIFRNTGSTSDIIRVMNGAGGFAEVGRRINGTTPPPAAESIRVINIIGWESNDLALLTGAAGGCTLHQVGTPRGSAQTLNLGGRYAPAGAAVVSLGQYAGSNSFALQIGHIEEYGNLNDRRNSLPEFKMYGVDDASASLVAYDMLFQTDRDPLPVADSVIGLYAAYGLDTNNDRLMDGNTWQAPTGDYSSTALLAGTTVAQQRLRSIIAVRVALIMRSSLQEKTAVQPLTEIKVFPGTAAQVIRTLNTPAELKFRYRVVEVTVPIRNALF